jgi:4-amino-4-deoxy-L-arabinose transferase-like glycosyltransferase
MNKEIKNNPISNLFHKYWRFLLILLIFVGSFSLRAYDMGSRYPFGWDQVDYAWTAKNMIINHEFPLVGMVVKQNTGFFIGPAYYYFTAFFYWLTNLNPVASNYIALVSSTFTFFVTFYVARKIFSSRIALVACVINSLTFAGFYFDVVQWQVSFLPGISLLIFYFLYKLLGGEEKYILGLALMAGLAFHTHFTAVFFPIIILLCLPFFPRNKKMFYYFLLSMPIFIIWFIPNIISQLQSGSQLSNMSGYLNTYYHGFHLRRVLQLAQDGFIQFDPFLFFAAIKPFKILMLPLFLLIFFKEKISKNRIILSYLILIFFLVPWMVFSTYRGEISDYYFSINRFIALLISSYLIYRLISVKYIITKIIVAGLLIYYFYLNLSAIIQYKDMGGLNYRLESVNLSIKSNQAITFQQGVPESYVYYYLMRKKGIIVY